MLYVYVITIEYNPHKWMIFFILTERDQPLSFITQQVYRLSLSLVMACFQLHLKCSMYSTTASILIFEQISEHQSCLHALKLYKQRKVKGKCTYMFIVKLRDTHEKKINKKCIIQLLHVELSGVFFLTMDESFPKRSVPVTETSNPVCVSFVPFNPSCKVPTWSKRGC